MILREMTYNVSSGTLNYIVSQKVSAFKLSVTLSNLADFQIFAPLESI